MSDETWAQACAIVLTTPTANAIDVNACRELMANAIAPTNWPSAFSYGCFFAACAYCVPRIIREING